MSSRLTLTTRLGEYAIRQVDGLPLVRCDRGNRLITCPPNTSVKELDEFSDALDQLDARRPPPDAAPVPLTGFRQYPVVGPVE